jgi:hypothetical protein
MRIDRQDRRRVTMLQFCARVYSWGTAKKHAVTTRLAARSERGSNTVETAIVTALLALAAVAVVGIIVAAANGWVAKIPK